MSVPDAQGPQAIWQVIHGLSSYWLVAAAVELGLFAALADRPRSVVDVASSCDLSEPQLAVAFDGLATIGLLSVTDGLYGLGPAAADFLVSGRPGYMGDLVLHSPGPLDNWTHLAATIRTGAPDRPVDDDGSFYAQLVDATFPTQYEVARRVAARMDRPVDTILDVGAGAAPWSVALLERFPDATAVVNDLPEVVPLAAGALTDHGVANRARLVAADYRTMAIDPSSFAVVVLGHVCRGEGAEGAAALIRRAAHACKPGGAVIVSDYFVDDERADSRSARLLGVTMMANTRHGATFTYREYRQWLAGAGFGSIELHTPFANQEVLIGTKGGRGG